MAEFERILVSLSVGTLLYPYGIAYRRVYGLSNPGCIQGIPV